MKTLLLALAICAMCLLPTVAFSDGPAPFTATLTPSSGPTPVSALAELSGGYPPYALWFMPSPPNPASLRGEVTQRPPWLGKFDVDISSPEPAGTEIYLTAVDANFNTITLVYTVTAQ